MGDREIVAALLDAAGFGADEHETDTVTAMYPIVRAAAAAVAATAATDTSVAPDPST